MERDESQPNKIGIMELFKPIPGYENYTISNLSRITGVQTMFLKPCKNSSGYLTVDLCKNGKRKSFQVHQLVAMVFLNHTPGNRKIHVDHINCDVLDNRLENLQVISSRENVTKEKRGTSKYTGVSWHRGNKKWQSQFWMDGKYKYLGYFETEIEASLAYQKELKIWMST